MTDLSQADPVAVCLAWLRAHPTITEVLGGPEHVSGLTEPPWPHVIAATGPSGDLRGMVWEGEFEVELEVLGAPNGTPGKAALWAAAMKVVHVLCQMPEEARPTETDPVVTNVRPSGVVVWSPLSNGQPRFIVGVMVTIHPPLR